MNIRDENEASLEACVCVRAAFDVEHDVEGSDAQETVVILINP